MAKKKDTQLDQQMKEIEKNKSRVKRGNPAKSLVGMPDYDEKKPDDDNSGSKKTGVILALIQLIASLVFLLSLRVLNLVPDRYLYTITAVWGVAWIIVLVNQLTTKKKGIAGKVISVLLSIALAVGSFYAIRTDVTIEEVTAGGNKKLDEIAVAVRKDDPAEELADAANYNFGVQYTMRGDDIHATVDAINTALGTTIATTQYQNIADQFVALENKEVDAIIFNQAYQAIVADSGEGINTDVKIIYTYNIEVEVDNRAADVSVEEQAFVVYLSGIDVYGSIQTTSRSDVNILAVVNPKTHQILLVTTPRDYYVQIPNVSGDYKDKLTHAGIYGVNASMDTLSALYETEIDFYGRVNFTSLVTIVDALGGIEVDSEYAFTTSPQTGIWLQVNQGINYYNGEQALAFARERHRVTGGDNQRGKNQEAVIIAILRKAKTPAILSGANEILNSVSANVDTNMSQDQIRQLIKTQLDENASWKIKSMAATGVGDNQACFSSGSQLLYVMQPDLTSIQEIKDAINAVKAGEILPESEDL